MASGAVMMLAPPSRELPTHTHTPTRLSHYSSGPIGCRIFFVALVYIHYEDAPLPHSTPQNEPIALSCMDLSGREDMWHKRCHVATCPHLRCEI